MFAGCPIIQHLESNLQHLRCIRADGVLASACPSPLDWLHTLLGFALLTSCINRHTVNSLPNAAWRLANALGRHFAWIRSQISQQVRTADPKCRARPVYKFPANDFISEISADDGFEIFIILHVGCCYKSRYERVYKRRYLWQHVSTFYGRFWAMNALNDAATAASISDAQAQTPPGQDRGPSLLAIQVVMMVSSVTAVVLRFISRRIGPGELWWDDWLILFALVRSSVNIWKAYTLSKKLTFLRYLLLVGTFSIS